MEVKQISVFLENKPGKLAHICRILADADIDLKALNIAETSDYGVLRIITDNPDKTVRVLSEENLVCKCTGVVAVKVPNVPGGLADVLDVIAKREISIEYMYSMLGSSTSGNAVLVFQTSAEPSGFTEAGLCVIDGKEIGIIG